MSHDEVTSPHYIFLILLFISQFGLRLLIIKTLNYCKQRRRFHDSRRLVMHHINKSARDFRGGKR